MIPSKTEYGGISPYAATQVFSNQNRTTPLQQGWRTYQVSSNVLPPIIATQICA